MNKKVKWAIRIAACVLLGAVCGFTAAKLADGGDLSEIFDDIDGKKVGIVLMILHIVIAAGMLTVAYVLYSKASKAAKNLDPDDDEAFDRIEAMTNTPLMAANLTLVLGTGLFGCAEYFLLDSGKWLAVISPAVFVVSIILASVLNARIVEFEKKLNPEKKGSVWESNFQKQWLDSCDEAQKQMIYKAGYEAFRVSNSLCSVLTVLVLLAQFVFKLGVMPLVVVTLVWLTMNLTYMRAAVKLEHGGNKDA
jgi:amino acid transporter